MEEIYKAVVLGIIQGLTEYLPISSTAHLRIIPSLFGWKDIGAAYTAVIQLGTMIAIVLYFRHEIVRMLGSTLSAVKTRKFTEQQDSRLFIQVIMGTIPILILGYLLKGLIRNQFRNMYLMASAIIFFSIIIYFAERYSKQVVTIDKLSLKDSLIIGFFQSIALIPGASRSGITIAGGYFRNMVREDAARFSFLLSIPAVLISGLYELYSERSVLFAFQGGAAGLIVATVVSGIVGYLSIWFLLAYLKTHSLKLFIVYRLIFGVLILVLLFFNIISN